ncbi:putative ABC transport system oligopeptide translocator [Klebsiella pneumoniae]|uniref:Putative ABC transport system oligopeptide translocator n=2 Tax=Gammaproteobacteria TaxID=1236 RepID=A0A2X3GST2_KLEPN|nr:putative ABC transport system oligopeptide translocator [Klebsiella pneumoniae]
MLTLSARGWRALRGNDIAMVLQDPRYALNPVQSIQTQLEEALTLHQRLSRRARAEAVKDAIAAVGLDLPVLSRYPGELSGGMGQRVMIALALLNNPKVLIADEPTSALDARLRNQILELLVEQSAQRQMAMLLISHESTAGSRALRSRAGDVPGETGRRDAGAGAAERDAPLHPHPVDLPAKCPHLRPDAADPRQNPGLYGDSPWRSLIFRIYRLHSARRRRSPRQFPCRRRGNLQPDRRLGLRQSTILRVLAGLQREWRGSVDLLGQAITPGARFQGDLRRNVQMVFQDPYASLHPNHTLWRTLAEPLQIHGIRDVARE